MAVCVILSLGFQVLAQTTTLDNQSKSKIIPNLTEPCGTDYIREEALKNDPLKRIAYKENIKKVQEYIARRRTSRSASSQYRIPVVVHVVHNGEPLGTGANISDAQIQSQIDKLNDGFDNVFGGPSSVFTDITFCLAENGPNGSAVTWSGLPGVNRLSHVQTHAGLSPIDQLNLMGAISWPSNQYLNIWVVSTINGSYTGVIGYAPQPLSAGPLDGIVIQANVFGDNSVGTYSLLSNYDLGMTLIHEAGHYLGLYHTFQGASCTETDCDDEGDMICDTPPTTIGSSCGSPACTGAQIENYMDYTYDACKNTYTAEQTDWMHGVINTMRSNLVSPENLVLTGVPCIPPGLLATFSQDVSQICMGSSVTYTAITAGNTATSFEWTFEDGIPSTATGPGPHTVTYSTSGDFDVTLETNDGVANLINTEANAVYVTDCGAGITGAQAQWYFSWKCALDFSSGIPVDISGSLITRNEGASSVCDASGNLEFYTDGFSAWNSSGLITSSLRAGSGTAAQGAVIVPDPDNGGNYYVFTNPGIEGASGGFIDGTIRYSLYEGATEDFPTVINQAPVTSYTVSEHLAAVPHCNGTDYWVIYHGAEEVNDKFLAYKVSTAGVSNSPVMSDAFPITNDGHGFFGRIEWQGQIDIAANGRLMAVTSRGSNSMWIYELNRANGEITLLTSTPLPDEGVYTAYGVSFSPNSEFLYVFHGAELRQYKVSELLTCGGDVDYKTFATTPSPGGLRSLQIGPDGKIYINRPGPSKSLDVINYPNEEITAMSPNAIGYNESGVYLASSVVGTRYTLPNMIDVPLGLIDADFDFCITNCGDVEFHNLSCGNTFSWDFGDATTSTLENPSHTYAGPGTYTVTFTTTTNLASGGTTSSTVTKTININIPATPSIVGPQIVDCPTPVNEFAQYIPSPFDPSLEYSWTPTGGALVGANPTDVAYIDWTSPESLYLYAVDPLTGCESSTLIDVYCESTSCGLTASYTTSVNSCDVTFTSTSTVPTPFTISSYHWDFGDGNTSTSASPTHTYSSSGIYTITLIVMAVDATTNTECSDTIESTVTVNCSTNCGNCEVEEQVYNGGFSLGNTGFFTSGAMPFNCSCSVGSYCVGNEPRFKCNHSLWIDDLWDNTGTATGSFMIVDGPTSYPTTIWAQSGKSIIAGQTYQFSFANVRAISGTSSTQTFDLKVGGVVIGTITTAGASANEWQEYCIEWVAAATTTATIEIVQTAGTHYNDYGIDDISFGTCKVQTPCSVKAAFNYKFIDPCTIQLINGSSVPAGVNITGYSWDFGDPASGPGNTSTLENPTHSFSGPGTYTVCLTVYAENGSQSCFKKVCKEVVIKGCKPEKCEVKPNFSFVQQLSDPCTFDFTDLSLASMGYNIVDWEWTVNGTVFSTDQNPSYTFPTGGVYEICLIAVASGEKDACKEKICMQVKVKGCTQQKTSGTALKAWPNPSNGVYQINITEEEVNNGDVKVYDVMGDEVKFDLDVRGNTSFVKLNTDKSGIYFFMIQSEEVRKVKLIKY